MEKMDDDVMKQQENDNNYIRVPMESEQICPVRSTSMAELMAVIFGFFAITPTLFT